ncbi:MAG: GatB/YqeY domain-containing protein [Flexistipes sinusarabici]|uniref:GatB/YqeY domain-containing protein n=1 Tax=Flexistipes sinusarabici TaxID=2352 RepID=A0A5D0MM55_FLESI|nr:GatB/YqeY domain-containing protein [Flexistipes sinusarabici]TYB32328.1 MAG: GatB/YqeY domain-containing protein [Flexistipes sinusarabici]
MALKEQILEDMKQFMRDKNQIALGAVRMLRSEIRNAEIEKSGDLNDDEIVKLASTAIKKRKDSASQYKEAGREDLASKELEEIKVLEKYMPEQLSEDEIRNIVDNEISKLDSPDKKYFGQVMKAVMAEVGNRADGKLVNRIVKEAFDANN